MATMSNNKAAIWELMQKIEVGKQTEHRLKATMSVLLARSENQILVLETLLKRLVQVCVHTHDKRLAKELKLMDFTRLAKRIGDDHAQIRRMIMEEEGILNNNTGTEQYFYEHMMNSAGHPPTTSAAAPHLEDPAQSLPGAASHHSNGMPMNQFRMNSGGANQNISPGAAHPGNGLHPMQAQQQQMQAQQMQQQQMAMRRDAPGAMPNMHRPDGAMHMRPMWGDNSSMDGSMGNVGHLGGMPGVGPQMGGQNHNGQGGPNARMRGMPPQMTRSASAANSQLTNQPSASSGARMHGYPDADAFSAFP